MKFTKESILKSLNSLTMPAWIKRVFQLIVDYIDDAASSIDSKADLVGGKVPAEQLPSYVDDVINFWDITTGTSSISIIINNVNYINRMWFITKSTSSGSIGAKYPNKFIDFGANTSEEDWTIIEPEEGKIYIKIGSGNDSNHSFRWSGINLIDLDKKLAAQLTENTYVIDSSKLNTVLTDTEANNILNASTLIVTNAIVENNVLAFTRGNSLSGNLSFCTIFNATNGRLTLNKIIYHGSAKKCSSIIGVNIDPYAYYASYGGKSDNLAFNSINNFLFDNTFIIDKTLLNTTISDTAIQNGIKRANILVVKDSTDNSYVLYIKGVANTDSHFFYNINTMISTSIDIKRVEFRISTNVLLANIVYFSSVFKNYQLGGGTKYTTESAFNAQFAKVIDMTVTQ